MCVNVYILRADKSILEFHLLLIMGTDISLKNTCIKLYDHVESD